MAEQFILVIEDDPGWQKSFVEIIGDAGFKSIVVSTYQDAIAALSDCTYALAVVDISLAFEDHADRTGVEVLKMIENLPMQLPTIVVTGYATVALAIETLAELNAVYFFRKELFDRREFMRVIKKETARKDLLQTLSKREHQVFFLMSEGRTNKQIAEELVVSVNTIKKHVQNIFTKFNVGSRAAAVAKAYGQER